MLLALPDIDQSNLTNAYVSGMKEDLNIEGNEYTYMQSPCDDNDNLSYFH